MFIHSLGFLNSFNHHIDQKLFVDNFFLTRLLYFYTSHH